MTRIFFIVVFSIMIVSLGCARQYRGAPGGLAYDPAACVFLRGEPEPAEFKGSGNITVCQGRVKQTGGLDVRAEAGGRFMAQIYSPLGQIVAEAEANEFKGHFKFGDQRHYFSYDDVMDIPLLPVTPRFTYREFIKTLAGGTPEILRQLPPEPDTITYTRRDAIALWSSDTLAVWMRVSRKNGAPVSATFDYGGIYARISRFNRDGLPREIIIKDLDGNYISIKYETIRTVRN